MSDDNRKFACIAEGQTGLFRLRALRDIGNSSLGWYVREGEDGGVVSGEDVLDKEDESWINVSARVIDSTVTGNTYISDTAVIVDSTIKGNARIYGNSSVMRSTIDGAIQVMGNSVILDSIIIGDAILITDNAIIKNHSKIIANNVTLNKNAYLVYEKVVADNITIDRKVDGDIEMLLRIRYGMPVNNRYQVYKLVKSTDTDGVYESIYNENYLYDTNKSPILKETQYDYTQDRMCARGIHCSFELKFDRFGIEDKADRLMTCLVDLDDIISIDFTRNAQPKLRAKKLRVRKVEKYPIEKVDELPSIILTHGLDTTYLIPIIYNNRSYELFRDFTIHPTSTNDALIIFDIDKETDSVDNYNFTMLAPNEAGMKNVYDPSKFSEEIVGDGTSKMFYVIHNLNSRNLIPTIFEGRGDGETEYIDHSERKNITNDCTIVFDEPNRVAIGFKTAPVNGKIFTVLLVKPAIPANTSQAGASSERGLLNLSNKAKTFLFQGSDVNDETHKISIKHNMSTYNIFGSIYDVTDNVYHIFDFDLSRSDPDNVELTLNFQFYKNHMYAFVYGWAY